MIESAGLYETIDRLPIHSSLYNLILFIIHTSKGLRLNID